MLWGWIAPNDALPLATFRDRFMLRVGNPSRLS
jgi:hypothetical protein